MAAPPPYPGNEKGMPPPPNPAYPQQQGPAAYPQQQQGYPAPPGYQPGYQQTSGHYNAQSGVTMVVVGQPACASFRDGTVLMRCPHCHADISTTTSFETGTCAYLWCIGLCLIGCDMGCCLLPFCCDACKDVVHSCPNCNQVISRYSRM